MNPQNPYDHILKQIGDMLSLIQKNPEKPLAEDNVTPEMEDELSRLESAIEMYNELAKKALELGGEKPEQIQKKIVEQHTTLSKQQQKFLKKTNQLKKEIADLQSTYSQHQLAFDIQQKKEKKAKVTKKFGDQRKKKFKRLSGGDKGWMPL